MKKLMMLAALVALPAFATKTPAAAADHTKDTEAIAKLGADFDAAWAKGDWKGRAAQFADDADLWSPMADWAKGKADIEKLFQKEMEGPLKGTTHKFTVTDTTFAGADTAYGDAEVTLTGMKTPDGKSAPDMKGKLFWVATKKNNKWAFAHVRGLAQPPPPAPMNTATAPTPAPAANTAAVPAKK